ncbi:hypothetical protein [Evansella tamaricis]|uniref:Uncharacterized protein n=1 Tax=Evansella tamaricis TaxID=2069301 RepID=A0ABS6JLQ4_9BACI|nr:hypothetical protein [Evansella tamaricis]MBU9714610.1 hypothetical protein [Evansella tamaricis]
MLFYSVFIVIPLCLYYLAVKGSGKERSGMEKMMLTMGSSMILGITAGVFLGGLYQGQFFASVILSVLAAVLLGFILGWPHGTLGIIEGIFTGGMAGLMGAMTAEMLPIPEVRILLLFLLLLSGLAGFWSIHYWKRRDSTAKWKLTILHILTLLYLVLITFLFIWYPPYQGNNMLGDHNMFLYLDTF